MDNKISIIVPNYNKELYITDCLLSIQQQTMSDFECIIIDDGSTDNSLDIIQNFIVNDNRFKLFKNINHGLSYSRNFGIKHATSELILPLDSDDYISKDYLERIIKYFAKYPELTLYYGKWYFIGHNANIMNNVLGNLHYTGYYKLLKGNSIHCCCAYKRNDAINCGLYDEKMQGYEDWEFLIRLLYKNKMVIYDPTISLYYRQLENNMSSDCHKNKKEKTQYILEKNIKIYREFFK